MFLVDFSVSLLFKLNASLINLDTRIYELFNVYFSKKYEEAPFIVMLIAVIVFKTFQISKKKLCCMYIFSLIASHIQREHVMTSSQETLRPFLNWKIRKWTSMMKRQRWTLRLVWMNTAFLYFRIVTTWRSISKTSHQFQPLASSPWTGPWSPPSWRTQSATSYCWRRRECQIDKKDKGDINSFFRYPIVHCHCSMFTYMYM